MEAGEDDEKWLICLNELDDAEAVVANIELRLGKGYNFLKKPIWNHYINFLRDRNPRAMLDVYRRYCRLFISDASAREEYRREIERAASDSIGVSEFWVDTVQFEINFGTSNSAHSLLERAMESMLPRSIKLGRHPIKDFLDTFEKYQREMESAEASKPSLDKCSSLIPRMPSPLLSDVPKITVHFKNPQEQRILPITMLSYIFDKATPEEIQNLHRTCKYLYAYRPIRFCHNLIVSDFETKFMGQSLLIDHKNLDFACLKDLYLTNRLTVGQVVPYHENQGLDNSVFGWRWSKTCRDRNVASKLSKKLLKCRLKYVMLGNQKVTLEELNFFISSRTIIDGYLLLMHVKDIFVCDHNRKNDKDKFIEYLEKCGIQRIHDSEVWRLQ